MDDLVPVETPAGTRAWLPAGVAQTMAREGRCRIVLVDLQRDAPRRATVADCWDRITGRATGPGPGLRVR